MLNLVFQRCQLLRNGLAFLSLLAVLLGGYGLVHIINGASLQYICQYRLAVRDIGFCRGIRRTRIMGHRDLAEVYANEFWSDVTDGAIVRHASISVVVLQTSVKSTQALPSGVCRRRHRACDLRK